MFEDGIGPERIDWIQRDQFVYFLDLERRLTDPTGWRAFRLRLVAALTAAWGLESRYAAGLLRHELLSVPQRRALHLLDDIHLHHNPASEWTGFREAMWSRRHELRYDLAP